MLRGNPLWRALKNYLTPSSGLVLSFSISEAYLELLDALPLRDVSSPLAFLGSQMLSFLETALRPRQNEFKTSSEGGRDVLRFSAKMVASFDFRGMFLRILLSRLLPISKEGGG